MNGENIEIGPCEVTFNGVNLGHTKGGVEWSYEPVYHEITVDQYGESVVDTRLMGEKILVKVALAEFTIANLKRAMPAGTFAGAADARVTLGKKAGLRGSDVAAQLVLHPIDNGTRADDIVIHKAFVHSMITLNHKNDEEKLIEVEFMALIDESKTDGNYLGLIGDSTA